MTLLEWTYRIFIILDIILGTNSLYNLSVSNYLFNSLNDLKL